MQVERTERQDGIICRVMDGARGKEAGDDSGTECRGIGYLAQQVRRRMVCWRERT